MSEQTPSDESGATTEPTVVPHPESGGPYVSLITGPAGAPEEKAPFKVVAGMALAQFGLFVALLAPVTVSLAIKVSSLIPGDEAAIVNGQVLAIAAFFALVANPLFGRLSDYTTSRWGRRRPWMFAGGLGFIAALAIVGAATNIALVFIGWILAQLTGNMILAPLLATIADQVPEHQRGSVSGNVGIMQNLGIMVAAYVALWFINNIFLMFVVPAVFAAICVTIYCILLPDTVITERPQEGGGFQTFLLSFWVNPIKHPNFGWVWISRFLVTLAVFLFINFRFFFLGHQVGITDDAEVTSVVATGVLINTIVLVIFAKLGGVLSDKLNNRKLFVIIATVIYGIGTVLLSFTHTVPMFYMVEVIMGLGYGVYVAVDTALVVDVLPNPEDSAKDLGVLNIANALPQSLAGVVGGILLAIGGGLTNYPALFTGAFVIALLGALTILPVRLSGRKHTDTPVIISHH